MLITFYSPAAAEVLMLTEHATPILLAAGKQFGAQIPTRGVFTAEQLGPAIAGIQRALDNEPSISPEDETDADAHPPTPPMAQAVSLHQRAYPLVEMMLKSQAVGAPITWEVSRGW
jgi:hypothetical protein